MNKKVIITIIAVVMMVIGLVVATLGLVFIVVTGQAISNIKQNEIDIKANKETVYGLFSNFPESTNIYYTSNNMYSERSIGQTIYQIDILANLTDNAYTKFVSQVELEEINNYEIKVNPNNKKYNWKNVKNTNVIKSKNIEDASIKSIYLDENTKTIYVIALGGN